MKPPSRKERTRGWLGEEKSGLGEAKERIESSSFSPSRPNQALPGDRSTVVVVDPRRCHAGRTQRERTFDLSRASLHLNRCMVNSTRHPRRHRGTLFPSLREELMALADCKSFWFEFHSILVFHAIKLLLNKVFRFEL